jgi:hypothetical protein
MCRAAIGLPVRHTLPVERGLSGLRKGGTEGSGT